MGRGPGPSIRNHEKVHFYCSSVLSLSASKILLHDKNVHEIQGKQQLQLTVF